MIKPAYKGEPCPRCDENPAPGFELNNFLMRWELVPCDTCCEKAWDREQERLTSGGGDYLKESHRAAVKQKYGLDI